MVTHAHRSWRPLLSSLALALVGACEGSTKLVEPTTTASVVYVIDAPLCGTRLPVEFRIDGALVGVDTFSVNIAPNHGTSRAFITAPGPHRVGARVTNGLIWSDSSVTLQAGQTFVDSLPFYCS